MSLEACLSGLLCGTSGYALYLLPPQEYPYAWTACAFGFTHGFLGLLKAAKADDDNVKNATEVFDMIMEFLPVPLVDIELYLHSSSNNIALGHGLFFIPLLFDPVIKKYAEESEEDNTDSLRNLTILGNIMAMVYLAVNENNPIYGGMALTAFLTTFGAKFAEEQSEGSGKNVALLGHSVFFYLTAVAVSAFGWDD